jgi:phosphoribosylformimino-5-aminoimidazole carboxamide ribotide isomerase
MRVIPVIDLLDDRVVHAVRGERQNYRPVQSVLCDTPDPIMIARSFRDSLGLNELYIADLNSIQRSGGTGHRQLIAALARHEKLDIILDAGISKIEDALAWLDLGVHKVIVGAETLDSFAAIGHFPSNMDPGRLVFSLDLRSGQILSCCPELAATPPLEALEQLQSAGWQEIILLDLSRVGSEGGVDQAFANEVRVRLPRLNLLVGGGIAGPEQLGELQSIGIAGVLVATALHRGIITAQNLSTILTRT